MTQIIVQTDRDSDYVLIILVVPKTFLHINSTINSEVMNYNGQLFPSQISHRLF